MLSYTEALQKVLSTARQLPAEEVALEDLCDRFLAVPVHAAFDLPRFDNSAVDGFGVLVGDVSAASPSSAAQLTLVGTIHAGESGSMPVLNRGETVKILTGAPVPPSVEAVVMREYCDEKNGGVAVKTAASPSENIRRRGDEVKQGQEVLPAGIQITPPVVGLIASFGHERFSVIEQPRVAVVVTGDELVKPGGSLRDGQIFESNSFALSAAVRAMGLPKCATIHALDSREATTEAFQNALDRADVIISAGGVSVGEHDYVKVALEEDLRAQTVFWRIAIKPGKPVYFGYIDRPVDGGAGPRRKLIFGLPGNPVSALVTFNLFVKPALRKMQGARESVKPPWTGVLEADLRKKAGRMDFVRGILSCSPAGALSVSPTRGQDSHMLSGLAKANCLMQFPADSERIAKGQCIQLELLDWHS
jgi:molybdopterin molybdotransferase